MARFNPATTFTIFFSVVASSLATGFRTSCFIRHISCPPGRIHFVKKSKRNPILGRPPKYHSDRIYKDPLDNNMKTKRSLNLRPEWDRACPILLLLERSERSRRTKARSWRRPPENLRFLLSSNQNKLRDREPKPTCKHRLCTNR